MSDNYRNCIILFFICFTIGFIANLLSYTSNAYDDKVIGIHRYEIIIKFPEGRIARSVVDVNEVK